MNSSYEFVYIRFNLCARRLSSFALVIFLALSCPATNAYAQTTPVSLTKAERTQIETMLTDELQRIVNTQKRIEGQGKNVTVNVRIDPHTEMIVVDLSRTYVPRFYGSEMEDLLHELIVEASGLLMEIIRFQGVEFRYDSKDIYHYFPEARPEELRPIPPSDKNATASTTAGTIVVAAGHGVYYNYRFRDWRAQRDPYNGIIEDFITPAYANELASWMDSRSGATIVFPRSTSTTTNHIPSGLPWWQMGARYHLQALYPDNPEIWNTKKDNRTNTLRERDEDINSRPLFARHIGANTLIHLHTNGSPNTTARGTQLYYHTGRAADKLLGDNILCYMKELIQAKATYENYTVPSQSISASDKAENSLATMPSVIVEVGFHSNPDDAIALQDPVFRTAAMKGVEKGYRLHTEDKPCEHFDITEIPDSAGPHGGQAGVDVFYEGFPQYPLDLVVQLVTCPPGFTCTPGGLTVTEESMPITYGIACNTNPGTPPASAVWRTKLTDADSVETSSIDHTVTCGLGATSVRRVPSADRPLIEIKQL